MQRCVQTPQSSWWIVARARMRARWARAGGLSVAQMDGIVALMVVSWPECTASACVDAMLVVTKRTPKLTPYGHPHNSLHCLDYSITAIASGAALMSVLPVSWSASTGPGVARFSPLLTVVGTSVREAGCGRVPVLPPGPLSPQAAEHGELALTTRQVSEPGRRPDQATPRPTA